MENLIFSLNATLPIFIMMLVGMFLKKTGILDQGFVAKLNKFVFVVTLPALLFQDLSQADFYEVWDGRMVVFCFVVTLVCILAVIGLSCLLRDKGIQGEFIQASYRSSAALLGMAFVQNIYGNAGMAPLMIIGTVPLYNIMAVIALAVFKPNREPLDKRLMVKTLKGIVTNPIILGIVAGLLWSLLRIPQPMILQKTVNSLAVLATPLGLMAMGASFEWNSAKGKLRPAFICSFLKLIGFAAIFLPVAIGMGFREEKLVAILVMLGSATTVSCFIMAKNMGHEGTLTSSVVMLTTLFSAFTLTFWLWLVKSLGLV